MTAKTVILKQDLDTRTEAEIDGGMVTVYQITEHNVRNAVYDLTLADLTKIIEEMAAA